MKIIFVLTLLFGSSFAWAAPNPAQYTVNVHVVSSQLLTDYWEKFPVVYLRLNVVIDGKKYELDGQSVKVAGKTPGLIVPGEYKARITMNKSKGTYAYARSYELLFSDGTIRGFNVVGESE